MIYQNFNGVKKVNGKISPLYEEIYCDILITEDNAGIIDHKSHQDITDKVVRGWINILNRITDKTIPICKLLDTELDKLRYTEQIDITSIEDFGLPEKTVRKYTLDVYILPENGKLRVITGAGFNFEDDKDECIIFLKVNSSNTTNQILDKIRDVKLNASHEVSHFIKHVYGNFQKRGVDFKHPDKSENHRRYLSYKHELNSNIAAINQELKDIKDKNPNINYSSAIQKTSTWKNYLTYVFLYDKDIKKQILKKTSFYWKNRLNGEIK